MTTPTPDRRLIPRLTGTGRAWPVTSSTVTGNTFHGVTDGTQTVYLSTKTEAVLAAKVHNLVNHHEN